MRSSASSILDLLRSGVKSEVEKGENELRSLISDFPLLLFKKSSEIQKFLRPEKQKNFFAENENFLYGISQSIENSENLEKVMKIVRFKEKNEGLTSSPSLLDSLIKSAKENQKNFYTEKNKKLLFVAEKKMELLLFIVHLILKNFPFYVETREKREKIFPRVK